MRCVALVALCLVLPGCIGSAPASVATGKECDYELDDYAQRPERLQVHWDLEGHDPRTLSGIEFNVTVYDGDRVVAQDTTTTDCLLIDMDGRRADRVEATAQDGPCQWAGVKEFRFRGGDEQVKIPMTKTC